MTPKEKAKELVLKYLNLQEPNYNWFNKTLAKQCALIAVDEIMNQLDVKIGGWDIKYWLKVKQEIEKL